MSTAPTVMVSSTFYDLRQVRSDLGAFVGDDLGYVPLLSEFPSFPVDPDSNTVDNCRARVEKNADILILIIGGRYGSIDSKTDKSITNLEFLAARQKGIPIYSFVEKSILALMPVWRSNPKGDFSSVVDTPRLFEFVDHVMTQERVWSSPFETARDIITILRLQFAYLFYDSLRVRLRLSGNELPRYFEELRPQSLKIALERPRAWEYRLLLQSWIDAVESRDDLFKEYRARLTLGPTESVRAEDAFDWTATRLHELEGLVTSANQLIATSAQEALGKEGEPGDPEEIIWVSRMLGVVLENMLLWARRIRCSRLEEPFQGLGPQLALIADDMISQFVAFPRGSLDQVEHRLTLAEADRSETLNLTIVFKLANFEAFQEALERARRQYFEDLG